MTIAAERSGDADREGGTRAARGNLIVLSGPSGVGKDAILAPLFAAGTCPPRLRRCVTATTRPPRPGEIEGVDYFFLSREDFERRIREGFFLEHARYADRYYGTPRGWVEAERDAGHDVLLKIDVQGALQVRSQAPDAVLIFIAPPSVHTLEQRLRGRDPDAESADVAQRLAIARKELSHAARYDYRIVNERIPEVVEAVRAIVIAERHRVRR